MKKVREDAHILINPNFVSDEEGKEVHSSTQQAIDRVKTQVEELDKNYKELRGLCQQKRDVFIVCVKFHMTSRQVGLCVLQTRVFLKPIHIYMYTHVHVVVLHCIETIDFNADTLLSQQ